MKRIILILLILGQAGCKPDPSTSSINETPPFPGELVDFTPISDNPAFSGTGSNTWDSSIRERGYILKEGDTYHMWYTGYNKSSDRDTLKLGYATSSDGLNWIRYNKNPIFDKSWTEDMMVLQVDGTYYMFAEGRNDIAHMLTSTDRIKWTDHGDLDIRLKNGDPIHKGPYGTPTVWYENKTWYLFYERNDQGIWLASSVDLKIWKNLEDEPVLTMGPELYDKYGLAMNQIIKYQNRYYGYYHGTAFEDWRLWSTNVAVSTDLIHWEKYQHNPIMEQNKSSGIVVHDGDQFRLYTMHNQVDVHFHTLPIVTEKIN